MATGFVFEQHRVKLSGQRLHQPPLVTVQTWAESLFLDVFLPPVFGLFFWCD